MISTSITLNYPQARALWQLAALTQDRDPAEHAALLALAKKLDTKTRQLRRILTDLAEMEKTGPLSAAHLDDRAKTRKLLGPFLANVDADHVEKWHEREARRSREGS